MKVYHNTELKNVKSIKKEGLKKRYGFEEISFADNIENALAWREILKESIDIPANTKWVLLKVEIPRRDLIFRKTFGMTEIIDRRDIASNKIKIVPSTGKIL